MNEKFYTTEQVANILQVHPFTILKFIKQGKLKGIKLGRVYRIKESDVHLFLDERMTQPGKKEKEISEKQPIKQPEKVNDSNNQDSSDHYYII